MFCPRTRIVLLICICQNLGIHQKGNTVEVDFMALTTCFQTCKWVNLLYFTDRINLKKARFKKKIRVLKEQTKCAEKDSYWAFFLWEELESLLGICIHVSVDMWFIGHLPMCLMTILNISELYELLGHVKHQCFQMIMFMVWEELPPGICLTF